LKNEFILINNFKQLILSLIDQFKECNKMLLDVEEHETVTDFNSDFDKWNFIDRCQMQSDLNDLRKSYECASLVKNHDYVISLA
jgi:hypothetical protein